MPAPRLSGVYGPDYISYTAKLGSESVTVTFDAAKMTGVWERQIDHAVREEDSEKVSDLILGVFVSWDVVDDGGVPVPLTLDLLLALPSRALINLLTGMKDAALPSSEEGNVSTSTSSLPSIASTSMPASPPNGQEPSQLPTPSVSQSQT